MLSSVSRGFHKAGENVSMLLFSFSLSQGRMLIHESVSRCTLIKMSAGDSYFPHPVRLFISGNTVV